MERTFNLLEAEWIPVRMRDQSVRWIAPNELGNENVLSLAANRPDFNGALIQFLIGLIQTTAPLESEQEWRKLYKAPPAADTLKEWFAPIYEAFWFDGSESRFMQDFDLRTEDVELKKLNGIESLLIEAPGEKTIKDNTDHFKKRNEVNSLCFACATTALFTLQLNAPSGGAGHRTSVRGGGPLTTLIAPPQGKALWHAVWLNIQDQNTFASANLTDDREDLYFTFPWLKSVRFFHPEKESLSSAQMHPAHVFWGMPRRIRLSFENLKSGACSICGRTSERLLTSYLTKNYGLNYSSGWMHPLSPYYIDNNESWLPRHLQPGGIGYKHWLPWVFGVPDREKAAGVVSYFQAKSRGLSNSFGLVAFGYDMNNMKARCWYEARLPVFSLRNNLGQEMNSDQIRQVSDQVFFLISGAESAKSILIRNIKSAWFSDGVEPRGDLDFIGADFWSNTEGNFYDCLTQLFQVARNEQANIIDELKLQEIRKQWLNQLINVSTNLFNQLNNGPIETPNLARIAKAYRGLQRDLNGASMLKCLGLPIQRNAQR